MLPTFVIALREGLEASLIVGIIAAFLRQQGRADALRLMWLGVGLAVILCLAVGIGLRLIDEELPPKGQEGLEAVVALIAVSMVTYMIVWMRRHARGLKTQLQGEVTGALESGSAWALLAMAFLAVLREGFETAVFLLAAFQDSTDPKAAGFGAVLGVIVAVGIGYGLYKGGLRLNLSRFFRITGAVLVVVAAGLVASALHSAAGAGWIAGGQQQAFDLSWLVAPGTISASLLTGMLGLQPHPTVLEVTGYLLYAIPMLVFVTVPDRVRPQIRAGFAGLAVVAAPSVLLVGILAGGDAVTGTAVAGTAKTVSVSVSNAGCEPALLRVTSGPTTFKVAGRGSKVTEYEVVSGGRILAEVENLASGIPGHFSLTLQPGAYETRCPGGASGKLVVTGPRSVTRLSASAQEGVAGYRRYLEQQTALLVTRTDSFTAALRAGDGDKARALFASAREPYERIEPVAESFGDLDPEIDARVNDVEKGQAWTGFHAIEKQLWVAHTTDGTGALAGKLDADVLKLQRLVRTVKLEPAQIANGATALLGEVSKSKVTGEEDRYSHTDLTDFQANVDGAEAAFKAIRPALASRDAALATLIDGRFAMVDSALGVHRRDGAFVSYNDLAQDQVKRLSQVVDALAEPLSRAPARALSS
jgi:high-affinity iron transporter